MLNRKASMIYTLVILTLAIVGSQVSASLQEWEVAIEASSTDANAAYTNQARNFLQTPGQYDRNGDGRVDLIISDRNGDGSADYWATDRNFDGKFNDYQYDRNFDGRIDQWEYDLDGDSVSDKIYVDSNNDGKANLYAMLNPITRTYTWYGNMNYSQAAGKMSFPPMPSRSVYQKSYRGGKPADSQ